VNATITITSVNDAPVNTVPGAQTWDEDVTAPFSTAFSSVISVADVDAGSSSVRVTLTTTQGALTLNGTTGLSFTAGDGTSDAAMTFTGTLTNINAALDGMYLVPPVNYFGSASVEIVTNDLGNTGSGGALSDTDSVSVTFTSVADTPQRHALSQ
jgi:hypothetical protein